MPPDRDHEPLATVKLRLPRDAETIISQHPEPFVEYAKRNGFDGGMVERIEALAE